MENPKITKKTTTTLTIKGAYSRDGMIQTDDAEYDLLALLSCFDGSEVKITVKNVEEDE